MRKILYVLAFFCFVSNYSIAKDVDHLGGYRLIVTSGLDSKGLPIDEIDSVTMDDSRFYIISYWNLPAGTYRYSCIIYDGEQNIVSSQHNIYESDGDNSYFWCSHQLDKRTEVPGEWYAEMGVEGFGYVETYFTVPKDDIRSLLTGNWDWAEAEDSCTPENFITISFNDIGNKMYHNTETGMKLSTSEKAYTSLVYSIVAEGDRFLRTLVVNETQKDEEGDMFLWDLVLTDNNSFCWKSSEWPDGHCTEKLVRCKN
ncbi:hypothetical protein [Shewanella sp. GXUN23E]|uniref:hypothetical protein n=1 Tax=Shewanella sp. GXUN23E TaxID=3422498 RepID=UPI003D7E044D